jgi:hypothetical protein
MFLVAFVYSPFRPGYTGLLAVPQQPAPENEGNQGSAVPGRPHHTAAGRELWTRIRCGLPHKGDPAELCMYANSPDDDRPSVTFDAPDVQN